MQSHEIINRLPKRGAPPSAIVPPPPVKTGLGSCVFIAKVTAIYSLIANSAFYVLWDGEMSISFSTE